MEPESTTTKKIKIEGEAKPASKNISSLLSNIKAKKKILQSQLEQTKTALETPTLEESKKHKEIEEKAELLKQKAQEISQRLSKITQAKTGTEIKPMIPPPLLLDSKGRQIDEKGNIVHDPVLLRENVVTFQANRRMKDHSIKEAKNLFNSGIVPKGELPTTKTEIPSISKKSRQATSFNDPSLHVPNPQRSSRSFKLLDPGKLSEKAERLQQKHQSLEFEKSKQKKKKSMITDYTSQQEHVKSTLDPVPQVEWWDKILLPDDNYNARLMKKEEITNLIEHPTPIKLPNELEEQPLLAHLTEKERKRLRRDIRSEIEKKKRQDILLGISPPPEPKIKIKNMMRVLGAEAVSDPTAIEMKVQQAVQTRLQKHLSQNESRKKTKEEKVEKLKEKMEKDRKNGLFCCVFKLGTLGENEHRYKIHTNAKALYLTGCTIASEKWNFVIVEGGKKAIQKFKKLMLERIKWDTVSTLKSNELRENLNSEIDISKNFCELVWEGSQLKPNFTNFSVKTNFKTESDVRSYLNHNWTEHFFDLCYKK